MDLRNLAGKNFLALKANPYPGRGIIVGLDEMGEYLVQVYWIMGRSGNSRNRVFLVNPGGVLYTAPADPNKVKDPSLIIYTAMTQDNFDFVVSNGHQTEDAMEEGNLDEVLANWIYEPDSPNFTPRITARFSFISSPSKEFTTEILVLKKASSGEECEKLYYVPKVINGFGFCVTTYDGDGDPLPSFKGTPYLLPLKGSITEIAQNIWGALNEDNKVSLAVKFINRETRKSTVEIINKYHVV
jgi:hypothetical protein